MSVDATAARHSRWAARAKAAAREAGLDGAVRQANAIAALPSKTWKGRKVWRIRCSAGHDRWEPVGVLWSLYDVRRYTCPWHTR